MIQSIDLNTGPESGRIRIWLSMDGTSGYQYVYSYADRILHISVGLAHGWETLRNSGIRSVHALHTIAFETAVIDAQTRAGLLTCGLKRTPQNSPEPPEQPVPLRAAEKLP